MEEKAALSPIQVSEKYEKLVGELFSFVCSSASKAVLDQKIQRREQIAQERELFLQTTQLTLQATNFFSVHSNIMSTITSFKRSCSHYLENLQVFS